MVDFIGLALAVGRRLLFVVAALFVSNPLVSGQYLNDGEKLLYLDEGEDGSSRSWKTPPGWWLKSNNTYRLGATTEVRGEKRLGHLPLLLHPDPKSAAFVGVGTGISMSAALGHPLERLVGVEIFPASSTPSPTSPGKRGPPERSTGEDRARRRTGLSEDDRSALRRHHLRSLRPLACGTGSLYTLEHFQAGRERLNRGGLFVQWLPLYQMSERELGSIAATFAAVFPHVSIWRGDFSTTAPIIGLAGSVEPLTLDEGALGASRYIGRPDQTAGYDSSDPLRLHFALRRGSRLGPRLAGAVSAQHRRLPGGRVYGAGEPIPQGDGERPRVALVLPAHPRVSGGEPGSGPADERRRRSALSPLAGNLLFVAMEAAREKNDKAQLALIKGRSSSSPEATCLT
ncbi:MAG: hypothetical protein MPW16_06835 [Candidatus Manganitrophus sp.]|nr:MAG: hypothetical protein MPW16_06835 [Candidatus Manganitrophus sp.]